MSGTRLRSRKGVHMPETEMRTSLCFIRTAGEVCYLRLLCFTCFFMCVVCVGVEGPAVISGDTDDDVDKEMMTGTAASGSMLSQALVKCLDAVLLKPQDHQQFFVMKATVINALKSLLAISASAKTTALECKYQQQQHCSSSHSTSSSSSNNRAFLVVSPRIWNNLPADVTSTESLSIFRQRLKTHHFIKSFPDYLLDIK